MDPSYVSSDDEAEAMAEQMGFSSFGAKRPPKKRKFNPNVDAVVEGQELASLDKGGKKGQGSGGNQIPLGKPRIIGVAPPANRDEIDLDDGEDEDDGPAYIDTSLPPPQEERPNETTVESKDFALAAQQKLAAIAGVSRLDPLAGRREDQAIAQFVSAIREPTPTNTATGTPNSTVRGGSFASGQLPKERRQRNPLWYIDYFDRRFIENPWAKLENVNS